MTYTYKTQGTCSRKITFDLEDGIVKNVNFEGEYIYENKSSSYSW